MNSNSQIEESKIKKKKQTNKKGKKETSVSIDRYINRNNNKRK